MDFASLRQSNLRMLAIADFWTLSGWGFGLFSLGIAVFEWIRKLFSEKDKDALRSHLRSINEHLNAIKASILETRDGDSVVKTDAGKKFLTDLDLRLYAVKKQIEEALADREPVKKNAEA